MPRRKKSSLQNHSRSSMAINKEKPQQRYAANARERARMRVLSRAFCRLKTTLPWVPADTKLSKLDTLRLAASYIAHLKGILRDETLGTTESSLHPAMSMTWPFGFNRPLGGSTGGGSQAGGSIEGSEDDMDDVEDGDNDDGESISSCTWEEASPPPPTSSPTKECIHLDSSTSGRRHGGARGKGNSNNLVQVRGKEISSPPSSTTFYLNKQNIGGASSNLSPTSNNNNNQEHLTNKNTQNTIIRPLSQIQQHHHHQHPSHFPNIEDNAMFPHGQLHLENKLSMAVTNLENIAVPISQASLLGSSTISDSQHQNDGGGMGMDNNSSMIGNGSFGGTDMNMNGGNFTNQEIHHHHQQHHHHQLSHLEGNNDEMQNVGQGGVYGYNSGDLMSIG